MLLLIRVKLKSIVMNHALVPTLLRNSTVVEFTVFIALQLVSL